MAYNPPTSAQVRALLGLTATDVAALKALVAGPVVATSYTVALMSSTAIVGGTVNVTAAPVGGGWPAGETLSPALGGIPGTFSPQQATPTAGSTAAVSFALTPTAAGTGTVTVGASPSMGTAAGVQLTVSADSQTALPAIKTTTSGATFVAGAAPGTVVAALSAPPSGATRTLLPGDGRLSLNSAGTAVVVGLSASSAGTINATVQDKDTSSGAVSPLLSVPVSVTAAQSAPAPTPNPTPAPAPANGAVLHSFNLFNWGTTPSVGLARQGVVFKQGQVPAGSSVKVQRGGADVSVQFDERRSWPDGSLALCVMHIRDSNIPANTRNNYDLVVQIGTLFSNTATTAPDQIAAGHDFRMTFANHTSQNATATTPVGSGTSTANLNPHMSVATRREMHHAGSVCDGATCWGMAQDATGGAVDAHLKTIWHVDRWKNPDGTTYAVEIGCEPAQDWWSVPGKTKRNYDASLMDGATVIQAYPAVPHMYNSHWLTVQNAGGNNRGRRHWIGGACPTLSYEPDRAYWIATGYIPPLKLDRARPPISSPGGFDGNAVYKPILSQEHRAGIDIGGAYIGRGIISNGDSITFLSQLPGDVAASRINSMAGLHVFFHHRSNRQRTRPGETADTANTIIAFKMDGPAGLPPYDFTAQGMPIPVFATADSRCPPEFWDGYIRPTGGDVEWNMQYGDGVAGTDKRANDASHAANYSYFMYLLEGERYHMEATCDLAMNTLHQSVNDGFQPPILWEYGTGPRWGGVSQIATGEERNTAWAQNLVGSAAGVIPDAHPASGHMKRLAKQQGLYFQATLDGAPPDMKRCGIHPWTGNGGVIAPWMLAFNPITAYHSWRLTGEPGIKAWADYVAQWSINNTRNTIYATGFYRGSNQHNANPGDLRTNPFLVNGLDIDAPVANATAATGFLTMTGGYVGNGNVLYASAKNYAGGDRAIPPELIISRPYYVRDCTTTNNVTTFKLSEIAGGAPVTFAADRNDIHFLQDYLLPTPRDTNGVSQNPTFADDTPLMIRAVLVEALLAGHPQMTVALLNKSNVFNSGTIAQTLIDWANWDYTVPASFALTAVAASASPPTVPNLRQTFNASDLFWVQWDMPGNMGTAPLFRVELSGDGGATYTVVEASTPLLSCQLSPGNSAPRSQMVRVTAINDAGASTTPATVTVTMPQANAPAPTPTPTPSPTPTPTTTPTVSTGPA